MSNDSSLNNPCIFVGGKTVSNSKYHSLLGVKNDCPCGKVHSCNIQSVIIRRGALEELPILTNSYRSILLVCDENTRLVCGNEVSRLIHDKLESELTFGKELLVPNEEAVRRLDSYVSDKTELIIGVGSGVINDLCKYVSHARGIPYFIVATAPSMDGYASKGAAMLFDGMKITTDADVPRAIIADTTVLKNAPLDMLRAGYGDVIGKYSCLNDWRLSNVIFDEYLCEYVYGLTYGTVEAVAGLGERIVSRDEESVAALMWGLVTVGIAMAYMGNSRPASGSEHHLSHFFEVVGLLRDEPYLSHGIDVAYSTYLTAEIRQLILSEDVPKGKPFSEEEYEKNVRRVYASEQDLHTAEEILKLQKRLGMIYESNLPIYRDKWEDIRRVLRDTPGPEEIKGLLSSVGLSISEFRKTYSEEKIADALKYAKYLKDRYTVLWLYDALEIK